MRSSWLALATKSARMRASRSCSVRSRNVIMRVGAPGAMLACSSGTTVASRRRSTGTRACSSTARDRRDSSASSTAASSSGARLIDARCPPRRRVSNCSSARRLAWTIWPLLSSATAGSGTASMTMRHAGRRPRGVPPVVGPPCRRRGPRHDQGGRSHDAERCHPQDSPPAITNTAVIATATASSARRA